MADAGPLVALLDRAEQHHAWAKNQLRRMERPLLTCDAVLTEAFYLLSGHPPAGRQLNQFLQRGLIVPAFRSASSLDRISALMTAYRDLPMSFADACLVCMVELHPGSFVFTLDRDFTVYRQQRRRVIPLIAPFQG